MIYFWLDANAIAKRYVAEKGTPLVNHFFANVSPERMICLFDSMDETRSVIVRKRNRGEITLSEFNQAIQHFEVEIVNSTEVQQVHATVNQKIAARELIDNHSINSTDAYILQCALDKANELREDNHDLIFVSSDKRLLNAAKKETLRTFDPETDSQAALDVLIDPPE